MGFVIFMHCRVRRGTHALSCTAEGGAVSEKKRIVTAKEWGRHRVKYFINTYTNSYQSHMNQAISSSVYLMMVCGELPKIFEINVHFRIKPHSKSHLVYLWQRKQALFAVTGGQEYFKLT